LNHVDISLSTIKGVYENVKNNSSKINLLLISYESESKTKFELVRKGDGSLNELKVKLDDNFRDYGYLRIQIDDEWSKRVKYVLIQYTGKSTKQVEKTFLTVHAGVAQKVLQQFAVPVYANAVGELTLKDIIERANRVGGTNHSKN
jgi:hypothetical protein